MLALGCHGDNDKGKVGPAFLGRVRTIRVRLTAQGLYDYVSLIVPLDAPGTLYDEEDRAIVAYIIAENDQLPPDTELSEQNAASVRIDNCIKEIVVLLFARYEKRCLSGKHSQLDDGGKQEFRRP